MLTETTPAFLLRRRMRNGNTSTMSSTKQYHATAALVCKSAQKVGACACACVHKCMCVCVFMRQGCSQFKKELELFSSFPE